MSNQPKINLTLSNNDKLFEYAGWLAILVTWFFVLTNYAALPETIPTHFNAAGEADGLKKRGCLVYY